MAASVAIYDTDEPPEEYARRVCEFHATNEGPLQTHDEVMFIHLHMLDPESRRRCKLILRELTKPGGEYAWLREQGKYAVPRRHIAERDGLPYKRVRRLPVVNRMRVIDKHRKTLAGREFLPATIKDSMNRQLDSIEQSMCRYLSLGRGMEMTENLREIGASTNNTVQVLQVTVSTQARQIAFLEEALLASLSGSRTLPPPEDAADLDDE